MDEISKIVLEMDIQLDRLKLIYEIDEDDLREIDYLLNTLILSLEKEESKNVI